MVNFEYKPTYTVEDLWKLVKVLRAPGGCPWDGRQTHQSIRRNLIEEAYEAAEAIDQNDPEHLREELGDVLLQVLFHASIEDDAGRFDLDDVADGICKKLIYRHPHVFTDRPGADPTLTWEELKRREKGQRTETQALDSVARSLPGLWRADKLQSKAAGAGFEWPDVQAALAKLEEELGELREAIADRSNVEEELGDLLFAAVKVGRFCGVDAENALAGTCEKFIRRFSGVEAGAKAQGKRMDELPLEALMDLWNQAKARERQAADQD